MASTYSVPAVYPNLVDQSQTAAAPGGTPCAIVGAFAQGPLDIQLITSVAQFEKMYGAPNVAYGYAGYCALESLGGRLSLGTQPSSYGTNQLYVKRVVSSATPPMYAVLAYSQQFGVFNPYGIPDPSAYIFPDDESFLVAPLGPGVGVNNNIVIGLDRYNATDNTFFINVYAASNLNVPLESWQVSKQHKLDGQGKQLYIEDAVNNYSQYIRVYDNTAITDDILGPVDKTAYTLGTDGGPVSEGDVINGWGTITDTNKWPMNGNGILINAGYSTPAVQQAMLALANARQDCMAFLDIPSASQSPTAAADYRANANINDRNGAFFSPDYQYYDSVRDLYLYLPLSGRMAANAAYTDLTKDIWWPIAGADDGRGSITSALKLRVNYDFGAQSLMYPDQINCIIQDSAKGIYCNGNVTAQANTTLESRIHISRLSTWVLFQLAKALDVLKFRLQGPDVMDMATQICQNFLLPVQRRQGISASRVVCDNSNNPPDQVALAILHVDVYIAPNQAVEFIPLNLIVQLPGAIAPNV